MPTRDIGAVVTAMEARLVRIPPERTAQRLFLETYRRTTLAVGQAVAGGRFEDPEWVERWDAVFADYYLAALDLDLAATSGGDDGAQRLGRQGARPQSLTTGSALVPRPWRLAFDAPASLPALRHVLLGINAHINFDLPQALLEVITDVEFADPVVVARRGRDHERIDGVLAGRVSAEDDELSGVSARTVVDRLLQPLNRWSSQRLLRESRAKVWHNTLELQRARLAGEQAYAARLGELEVLSAARIADLLAPGQVLLRLAVAGFGVTLPPPRVP